MTFSNYYSAMKWAKIYGRENCRPCDKWEIVKSGPEFKVAIKFKTSGDFVGYAEA